MSTSIYIHIPFCSRRCDYCDFATWTDKSNKVDAYVGALVTQWKYHMDAGHVNRGEALKSIFFGGGTPNFIDANYIEKILSSITEFVSIDDKIEITLESNPDHVDSEKLKSYVGSGVNRISLGVQSTQNHILEYLGREHDRKNVFKAFDLIRNAGITNISCDLIYGSPNETLDELEVCLKEIIELEPTHISAYALGVENGTPLATSIKQGNKVSTNEDDLANKYELCDSVLNFNSYHWYEISNWCLDGFESIHNQTYWMGGDVIALGCAAHGVLDKKRWSTPRHIDVYLEKINQLSVLGEQFFIDQNAKDDQERRLEEFALRIRTKQGHSWPSANFTSSSVLKSYIDMELIKFTNQNIYLTLKGRLLAHRVAVDLFEEYKELNDIVE